MGLCCSQQNDGDVEVVRNVIQPLPSRSVVTRAPQIRAVQPSVRPRKPAHLSPLIRSQPSVVCPPPHVVDKRPLNFIDTGPSIIPQPSISLPTPVSLQLPTTDIVRPPISPYPVTPSEPTICPRSPCPSPPVSPIITVNKQNTDEQKKSLQCRQEITRNDDVLAALRRGLDLPHVAALGEPCVLEPVHENTSGYYFVTNQFGNRKFQSTYEVTQIERVRNPYLSAQYALKKKHFEGTYHERWLFHGTGYKAAMAVAKFNFDWRLVENKKFGMGVSFANNPWYASHYSKRHKQGNKYIMILAQVLVEPGRLRLGNYGTVIPPIGYTTTNPSREVLVKYDDATFYPEYIVHFQERYFYSY